MWLNKQSKSAAPRTRGPKVPANSGSPTGTTVHAASLCSPTMTTKGEISGNEDLLVDGKVEGPISVGEHKLTVGRNGHVTGGLTAPENIIYCKNYGNQNVVRENRSGERRVGKESRSR